jgi:predicted ATPase
MSLSVLGRYRELVADGRLEADPAQAELAARLDRLAAALVGYRPGRRAGALQRLIGARPSEPPRGVYIHGAVGHGKTLLMDLFFEAAPVAHRRVTRTMNLVERLFVEERRRLKIIPNSFDEKPVLKLMFGALIRAAEHSRGLRFTEFELRQLAAARK